MTTSIKRLTDKEFAKRLDQACDLHGRVPPFNKGRQLWLAEKMSVSIEATRKWFSGESRPRPDKMAKLAELLRADESWLSLGMIPDKPAEEKPPRNAAANGAVNLVAGLIQLSGGVPSFFKEGDRRAANADILAIIRGTHHEIVVMLGHSDGRKIRFSVPSAHENVVAIGVVINAALTFDLLLMPSRAIAKHGRKRGAHIDVLVDRGHMKYSTAGYEWPRIKNFDNLPLE
jgi:transcriptional regulator with XRE-family HTH domain